MQKITIEKIIAITGIIILVINLVLIAIGKITWITFWIIVAIIASVAYFFIPWMKKIKK